MNNPQDRAIAIVGVGAIMPDALDAETFWQNILAKRYSISDVPKDRWDARDHYHEDPTAADKTYSKIGGWVSNFEFDWKKFRVPPKVSASLDPSQQWALTAAAQALADYGYPERPLDTERTGVIIGTAMGGDMHFETHNRVMFPEFAKALDSVPEFKAIDAQQRKDIVGKWRDAVGTRFPEITEDSMPGELANVVAGRVANFLNLRGPNFTTDAACASSLAALATAVQMLNAHHCDAILTGGVDRNMAASTFVKFAKIGALSSTGSRPFGEGADGFVMGEGCAFFLLKRLADAERGGDRIYAVIRGVGESSDGKGKGITAPNPVGQELAIRRAWEDAGLAPETAGLVEAHGTSTRVGDEVELKTLAKVFANAKPESIALGSVKSNIGHLKSAAGAAALMKAVKALATKTLPPTLNANPPTRAFEFNVSPFALNHDMRPWAAGEHPRRAAVSSYGFGGTNFHIVLEEHVPGLLTRGAAPKSNGESKVNVAAAGYRAMSKAPVRSILAIGATDPAQLRHELASVTARAQSGWMPAEKTLDVAALSAAHRLVIDFGSREELVSRLAKAEKAFGTQADSAFAALGAQGIFRGQGQLPGKIAFLFPGQGSQYLNMARELAKAEPIVQQTFAEADQVMEPILGKTLTSLIFADAADAEAVARAELALTQTAVTQPAMLTVDTAICRMLNAYGIRPDFVMGHSLGEYAALIAAGAMPFAHALEASAARGAEMTKVSVVDPGAMAAVFAPLETVTELLKQLDGYVVAANINSPKQCVIGGATLAVEQATLRLNGQGFRAQRIPVSHAFHTQIVAPAAQPLRRVLDRLDVFSPCIPLVANVTGERYPTEPTEIRSMLEKQIASPVQWVKGLTTLYQNGVRVFVEVGPKKALKGFVDDLFGDRVLSLATNHPKVGDLQSFNQALCNLLAAGWKPEVAATVSENSTTVENEMTNMEHKPVSAENGELVEQLMRAFAGLSAKTPRNNAPFDRSAIPFGSVVISGVGLGLPGAEKSVMDPDNALRLLRGEQFIDLLPERFRDAILSKQITRLVKEADGTGRFERLSRPEDVIRLAGRPGSFDLAAEYGIPEKLVEALDITTQLAMAAGLDALREAGIPLVRTYRQTSTGKQLPEAWMLPEVMRDETGVIFASAFPGVDRLIDDLKRYYVWQGKKDQVAMLEELRTVTRDEAALASISQKSAALREELTRAPYEFDRRFVFQILAMGHAQFAEYIGARGPNTHVNAACASGTQGLAIAEDWIRTGRCRRVVVITADNVTSENGIEWLSAGFLALGAVATDDRIEDAVLPFDKRRHGMVVGMGATGLVVESEDAVRERGMRGIVEVLNTEIANSAFHASRLNPEHISMVMDSLVTTAEKRFGLNRYAVASQLVFVSHETYTPARGGSASAEIAALRRTFGTAANQVVIANTKGSTGHAMGAAIEDAVAVKILEHGMIPPVANFKEPDPELGMLNLSKGGYYPVQYALHLAAGFGSQIVMTLLRRIPGSLDRLDNRLRWQQWLAAVSGYDRAETEVEKRVLRIREQGAPTRAPLPSQWIRGTGPQVRTTAFDPGSLSQPRQESVPAQQTFRVQPSAPATAPAVVAGRPSPAPVAKISPTNVTAAPVPAPASVMQLPVKQAAAAPRSTLAAQVLSIVAKKTGYPEDMLDMELDLEADLGIDTVKQAETLAEIRSTFNIPAQSDMRLRDYPTLAAVVQFVAKQRPDLADGGFAPAPQAAPASQAALQATQTVATPTVVAPASSNSLAAQVVHIVAKKTGYPEDMLDMELDLEADLGIDTVKQAETLAEIRSTFNLPAQSDMRLRDYPTLAAVVQFVAKQRPDLADGGFAPAPQVATAMVAGDSIEARVLDIVAAKTGYPKDMLDLALDLEADLGIDTVKQAETFAEIRSVFSLPRQENMSLRNYPTLAAVVQFVRDNMPGDNPTPPQGGAKVEIPVAAEVSATAQSTPAPVLHTIEAANKVPRRIPVPVLRPGLDACKSTGVELTGRRIMVGADQNGTAEKLTALLTAQGATVLSVDCGANAGDIASRVGSLLADGPVHGVYWLKALDVEPGLAEMDINAWRHENHMRVKSLYTVMHALAAHEACAHAFLVSGTRLGGLHGYGDEGATAPLGGAVVGFTKAYKRERPEALVKAVDFAIEQIPAQIAEILLAETLTDPGTVEVGYRRGLRFAIGLREEASTGQDQGIELSKDTVFVVTGAAGSITSAIVADLAAASHGTFYLLDRVEAPNENNTDLNLVATDREALKRQLIERAKAAGDKPTPTQIDKQLTNIERQAAAMTAMRAVTNAGGAAHYHSVDLTDDQSVRAAIAEVQKAHDRIDVLVHAAGIEISRPLADKSPEQFNLIFDVKADGFFSLLKAAGDMPIGATVVFSSIAGRFGNGGQTDYSAANDLLCKMTSHLKRIRPHTRAIAIDWTAWRGIGMASRGSIPAIMEKAGIDMLDPESGIPTVRRELTTAQARKEIVVGDRLGMLIAEWDATGGLDPQKAEALLAGRTQPWVMLGRVKAAKLYGDIEIETELDPQFQPFLYDHRVDNGLAYLPGVMGIESFAEMARFLAPGFRVQAISDVRFVSPFKFYHDKPRTLLLNASVLHCGEDELVIATDIKSARQLSPDGTPRVTTHFSAQVTLTRKPYIAAKAMAKPMHGNAPAIARADIYERFFHGPAYQVLEVVHLGDAHAHGVMAENLPTDVMPETADLVAAPRCVEMCFQTAGVWEIATKKTMALPNTVGQVVLHRQPEDRHGKLHALVDVKDGGTAFDAKVVDDAGHVFLTVTDYRTVPLAASDKPFPVHQAKEQGKKKSQKRSQAN